MLRICAAMEDEMMDESKEEGSTPGRAIHTVHTYISVSTSTAITYLIIPSPPKFRFHNLKPSRPKTRSSWKVLGDRNIQTGVREKGRSASWWWRGITISRSCCWPAAPSSSTDRVTHTDPFEPANLIAVADGLWLCYSGFWLCFRKGKVLKKILGN